MQIIIREYEKIDQEQLKVLLDLSFEEEDLLSILNDSRYKFAYSAYANDELVGVAFGWISSFHPNCTYFKILSHPVYAYGDVIEKLLSKIESLEFIDYPLQTSIWETSLYAKGVYEQNGFKEIRRTYMPTLHLADFKETVVPSNMEHRTFKSLANISSNTELVEQLLLLTKRNYEDTHKANPVAAIELDEWKRLILAEDVVTEGSFVCLDSEEKDILAYSFLYETDDVHSYELGWCGCLSSQDKKIIPQLILEQIKYSNNQNVRSIVGEFDTTDSYALEVLRTFPFTPSPTWITYQKKGVSGSDSNSPYKINE